MAGFIKRITTHRFTQNMKALGLVVLEKKIFYVFPMMPQGRGLYSRPGAWLSGFIKRAFIHCYTQNRKALGLVVFEKKIYFYFFPL